MIAKNIFLHNVLAEPIHNRQSIQCKMDTPQLQSAGLFALTVAATLVAQNLHKPKTARSATSTIDSRIVTVSAPGKVLIAGGYLVLEKPNAGVTIAATSRFYTSIKLIPALEENKPKNDGTSITVVVTSPQFKTEYVYLYTSKSNLLTSESSEVNPFVETCLKLTFSFLQNHLGATAFNDSIKSIANSGRLSIKLRADNDFYSQTKEVRNCVFSLKK